MSTLTLQHHLIAIAETFASEEQLREQALQKAQTEQECLRLEFEALQQKLVALHGTIEHLQHDLTQHTSRRYDEQVAIICAKLKESAGYLIMLSKIIQIAQQRAVLLATNPDIERDLKEFQEFEATRETTLQQVPASYRTLLLDAHEAKRIHVTPLLDLMSALAAISLCDSAVLHVLVAYDQQQHLLVWVLPFAYTASSLTENETVALDVVQHEITDVIHRSEHPHALVIRWTSGIWAGYHTVLAEVQTDTPPHLDTGYQSLIREQLTALAFLNGAQIHIEVTPLSMDVWSRGLEQSAGVGEESEATDANSESDDLAETTQPGSELQEDISERNLNATPEMPHSNPQPQEDTPERNADDAVETPEDDPHIQDEVTERGWLLAEEWGLARDDSKKAHTRRLQLLLRYFLACGYHGGNLTTLDQLWLPLPAPQREEVRIYIETLIESNVLVATTGTTDERQRGAINHEKIIDVQELINQKNTPSPFWAQIISNAVDRLRSTQS